MVMRFQLDQKIGRVAAAAVGRSGNHGNRVDLEANYLTNSWHSDNIGAVLSARLRRQLNIQCEDR